MLIKLRFRFPEVFFGILLAVAIFVMGALFWSSQNTGPPAQPPTSLQSGERGPGKQQEVAWWQDPVAVFTLGLVFIGLLQAAIFFGQMRLIRKSLGPAEQAAKAAQDAATAAKTQADGLMASEGAHLYVIIKGDTIAHIFQIGGRYDNSPGMNDSKMNAPGLQYVLKNYGKTPAMLQHVLHGMSIQKSPGERRTFVARDVALEIIGVDGESRESIVTYDQPFTFGDARSLVTDQTVLSFYGEAEYLDIFGTSIQLKWEFIADRGALHQIEHREQRRNPQAESATAVS
jgi:hypothetical protein